MSYVLRETLASKEQGHDLWFKQMTGIGPMTTPDLTEAARFESEESARACPAMHHALSFYEIEEAPSLAHGGGV